MTGTVTRSTPRRGRPDEGRELLTAAEVAAWLEIDERTVRKWSVSNRFPAPLRCGPKWVRWRRADIDDWIAGTWTPTSKR